MNPEELIKKHLQDVVAMQIATARDNKPWVCTVRVAIDDSRAIYWVSMPEARHSKEIADNPNTAAAVALKVDGPLIGLQTEGQAYLVTDHDEIEHAARLYQVKQHRDDAWLQRILTDSDPHKLYCLKPRMWMTFDTQATPEGDPRHVWEL